MDTVRFEKHKGKDIIIVDVTHAETTDEKVDILDRAGELIKTQAPKSALVLTDVRDVGYDITSVEAMKNFASGNTPYVKASAVVGVTGMKKVIFQSVVRITGRKIQTFDEPEKAKDWLAEQ